MKKKGGGARNKHRILRCFTGKENFLFFLPFLKIIQVTIALGNCLT